MTTRSGTVYRPSLSTEMEGDGAAAGVADLAKMIVDERKQRDKEMLAEHARREAESRKQFELLAKLVEGATASWESTTVEVAARSSSEPRVETEAGLKLTKLSDADNVEAYLTTFSV